MSIHISAKPREIAKTVLLAGDPLRAKYIAKTYLKKAVRVSRTRNAFYYTGTYKKKQLTVGASGMGCPSIGIYSYELYTQYDVESIMRIGTCGAYLPHIKLYDLINVERAFSESTYAKAAFGFTEDHFYHQGSMYGIINDTARTMKIPLMTGGIHSGDAFYRTGTVLPQIATENDLLAAEMEAFALFANAKLLSKSASCLLTVSDNIVTHDMISPAKRERSLDTMIKLALESAVSS